MKERLYDMMIGFMRTAKKPSAFAELTAMLCRSQGLNLLFMRPDDVDMNSNTVKGQLFHGSGWSEVTTEIPLVIDSTDRKSTRLNSSHVSISYAVFCLKKKKTS